MAHHNYYLDICVEGFVVNNGAVLLRMHEKYNFWNAPGGHLEEGEDVNEAVHREVMEEVGLEVELVGPIGWTQEHLGDATDLVPPIFVKRVSVNEHHDHCDLVFVARADSRDIKPQEEASQDAECRWLTQEELDELHQNDERLYDDVYRYASTALQLVE